uniref:Uncharacterized protein n=1 Tax=Varanus komodoensis TaxID=61221 RepID=A0A8D2JD45_VARKO
MPGLPCDPKPATCLGVVRAHTHLKHPEDRGRGGAVPATDPERCSSACRSGEVVGSFESNQRFLPKSHLSKVIIHDNTSVQRVQDIKVRLNIEDSKKKVSIFFDQMKKKFVRDQQKKMTRWKKEYTTEGIPHRESMAGGEMQ